MEKDPELASIFAYTAGIIDGEGTIACYWDEKKKHYHQYVRVRMKYQKVPKWLKQKWGGAFRQGGDNTWAWVLSSIPAAIMLKDIYPYIVEKKTQARIFMRLRRIKETHTGPDKPKVAAEKKKLFILLKSLHG